ncbi:helix-turn-helix transcriptional regulator [Stutzerimonas stutzeri]|uniref:helix-turn-helix transcriptional regulator n=1 Tax=Stutzerimonas stutzeri TaxID=316 RepID=UPI00210C7003|nr:AraC family transcriptional regulator [Stutzerimonas stutzeri]MCQ4260414.1 AraC family transcriptional regulator [Stutzerimonas stutzeri]
MRHPTSIDHPIRATSRFWRDAALPFIEARTVFDGRLVCYARHSHETFSIGVIDSGVSSYINGDHECRIDAGTLVLMNPGDVHACNPIQNQQWAYRMLYVDAGWLSDLQDSLGMAGAGFRRFSPILTRDPQLQAGFNRFHSVLIDEGAELLQKERAAVSFFSRLHERLGFEKDASVSDVKLQRAASFIADNYPRSLKLHEISHTAGVSPSSLIRAFKKHFGMTPHAYLINRRVQFARAELRRGQPIADVALAAGFADQAHLQRAFKQLLAATPGHYRDARRDGHQVISK